MENYSIVAVDYSIVAVDYDFVVVVVGTNVAAASR